MALPSDGDDEHESLLKAQQRTFRWLSPSIEIYKGYLRDPAWRSLNESDIAKSEELLRWEEGSGGAVDPVIYMRDAYWNKAGKKS